MDKDRITRTGGGSGYKKRIYLGTVEGERPDDKELLDELDSRHRMFGGKVQWMADGTFRAVVYTD